MPADLTKPFAESCCDGGACSSAKESAQSCGCDPGINWVCRDHQYKRSAYQLILEWRRLCEHAEDGGMKAAYALCAAQLERTVT